MSSDGLDEAYRLHERQWSSYAEMCAAVEWRVPDRFNIAAAIADRWGETDRLALLAVDTVVAVFVVTGGVAVFGTGYFRMRATPNVPLSVRARRRWRQFRR